MGCPARQMAPSCMRGPASPSSTGAGDREIPHHADEWVEVDELLTTCKLYAATAMY